MAFEAHCIVEIMGHQVIAGKVSEETHFGAPLMRVDVPKTTRREAFTVYYGGGAIYKITPTTEEIAAAFVEKQDPEPVKPYMLALPSMVDKVYDSSPDFYPDDYGDDGANDDYDDERNTYDEDDDFDEDDDPNEAYVPATPITSTLSDTERAIRRAKELMTRKFVILDTETTGFDSDDEIIQIAIIGEAGETVLKSYIKPTKPITNTQYHGITDEMVKDAPSFPELYPQLEKALNGNLWLIYNADYDTRMLNQVCRKHDLAVLGSSRTECVMLLYADYVADWDEYHGNNRWQKLEVGMKRFGLQREGKEHDALSDCKATLAVLKAMAAAEKNQCLKPTRIRRSKCKEICKSEADHADEKDAYPANWDEISTRIKELAGWKCERCGAVHNSMIQRRIDDPSKFLASDDPDWDEIMYFHSEEYTEEFTRVIISVHHIGIERPDGTPGDAQDKTDCRDENLIALCQRCHLLADQPHNIIARKKTFQRKRIARVLDAGQLVLFDE